MDNLWITMIPWYLWAFLTLISLVIGYIGGWIGASIRFATLAYKVAQAEAAIQSYWDRVRKRMRVEPIEDYGRATGGPGALLQAPVSSLTGPQIEAIARKNGIWMDPNAGERP